MLEQINPLKQSRCYDIAVIGLGNIGVPVARHISNFDKDIVGFDISEKALRRAESEGLATSATFPRATVYVVAVNTWFRNGKIDMSAIEATCKSISETEPEALVLLESTLEVGTTRKLSEKYGLKRLAVCPHRWWAVDESRHGVSQDRVIGAVNKETLELATQFYFSANIPVHPQTSPEIAELSKIVENTDYYLDIAYAQTLKMMCDKFGLCYEELKNACNTKWNVNLLEPREGIGGECLPKDIQFLLANLPDSALLKGAVQSDVDYRKHWSRSK